jgi:hypothetical protein
MSKKSIIGKKFGKWTVIKYFCQGGYYFCHCKCGTRKAVRRDGLITGKSKSCGCYALELASKSTKWKRVSESYRQYKFNAKLKKLKFNISKSVFRNLVKKKCYYCNGLSKRGFNGLDRVNNKKGYILNNVVPCCNICNQAKYILTKKTFYNWIKKVYKNLKRKNL